MYILTIPTVTYEYNLTVLVLQISITTQISILVFSSYINFVDIGCYY